MLIFGYVQLLMIGRAGQWTRTPSATPSSQKNEMFTFGLCSTFIFLAGEGWQMGFESIDQPGQSSEVERIQK